MISRIKKLRREPSFAMGAANIALIATISPVDEEIEEHLKAQYRWGYLLTLLRKYVILVLLYFLKTSPAFLRSGTAFGTLTMKSKV
ncbi:hypothetical protein [Chlorogloeopsis fritschii]|uniref:hypothetical protein n=1 Tax=Chlorogloeopsis fritschii TaxID=1124 RepID=UPI0023F09573|nr:hypothetical protein [Chlorogloeopsis fritschii]